MKLSQAAAVLGAQHIGQDVDYHGVVIDSRTLQPGALFVAVKGEHFDGHDFIVAAKAKGAVAALVQKPITDLPCIVVPNTIKAFGQLAAQHRSQFAIPLFAVTGSCGKTTVKTMLASILRQHTAKPEQVLASESSFNNEFGLPLTVLQLNAQHQYFVQEMGTNHFGEIAYLTQIAKPTVAMITNAAEGHLEGLGSVEGVSRAKGEIFQGLAKDGVAILNADDTYAPYWKGLVTGHKIAYFGEKNPADFMPKNITFNASGKAHFTLVTPKGEIDIQLPILGRHNVINALAAAAAASVVGVSLETIKAGLEVAPPVSKRLNEYVCQGARVIDDSYNANPLSVKAALDILAHQPGEKILVLGDMRELGANSVEYHRTLGAEARRLGIQHLYTFGELTKETAQTFGATAQHFVEQGALIAALKKYLHPQAVVLIKGSRSMHMERVVEALVALEKA